MFLVIGDFKDNNFRNNPVDDLKKKIRFEIIIRI